MDIHLLFYDHNKIYNVGIGYYVKITEVLLNIQGHVVNK
ncbi:hypothetical protein SAMN05428977_10942 [Nitrosomonas sp. Nm166]|nr:hypothetical protein SAMN05428977_10942 [Nitrosomonas sp. Nm166]